MKILIVDDSPDALAVAKARLTGENLEILCADGGKAGLAMAECHQPDLILLDVDMPDLSGFEVCRALKSHPTMNMIPVLFLSGSGGPGDKVRGLDLGAVDFVSKPFDAYELKARVRAALRTKRLQDLLVKQARIDPLTGLANRGAMDERLSQEWARAQRTGRNLSFIMADLDHFKDLNDTHGHQAGDMALQQVASAICDECRINDLPARYGGEEFAIVVPDESASQACRIAERCRQRIASLAIAHGDEDVTLTASFGVSDNVSATSHPELVQHADESLYEAKQAGRNRVKCSERQMDPAETPEGRIGS